MKNLIDKKILYIICGGISAYKSLETIRLFKRNGAQIKTILTNSAKEFITCLLYTYPSPRAGRVGRMRGGA